VADRRDRPDAIVERALESLRVLPPVRGESVERVVAAAARARTQDTAPDEDDLLPLAAAPPRFGARTIVAVAAAIASGIVAIAVWRAPRAVDAVPSTGGASTARPPAQYSSLRVMDSRDAAEAVPVPTQFVFHGSAHRVALVGDFNNWDDRATPLEREPGSTLWSVTVPIQRGRHIYAFLVDSVWTVDKRAPVASDPDFGVTGSVILVGRP
jgi:hypothetical protein